MRTFKIKLPLLAVVIAAALSIVIQSFTNNRKFAGSYYEYTGTGAQNDTSQYTYRSNPPSCESDATLCKILIQDDPDHILTQSELQGLLNMYGNATHTAFSTEQLPVVDFKE